ncbi:MAG: hypothetical protein ACXADB_01860 [Candidatus Hermodarchaeia archaeon]
MPDWVDIVPVIMWQGWIYVHDAPSGVARNSPEQGAGDGAEKR